VQLYIRTVKANTVSDCNDFWERGLKPGSVHVVDLSVSFPQSKKYFFPLWLYSPILGLGCLHKTFRFISISRSRTVGRTPWTGDQLVARPLLTAAGDCDDGEFGGMNGFGRGKPNYSEKTCPDATISTTNPTRQTRAQTRAAAVGNERLTPSAMAWPKEGLTMTDSHMKCIVSEIS
jgi:hypothetical protein